MSAISAEPVAVAVPDVSVRPLDRVHVRTDPRLEPVPALTPRVRPVPRTKTPSVVRKKHKSSTGSVLMLRTVMFVTIGAITWSVSSLSGQVLAETARREGIRAHQRAEIAQKSEASLRERVDLLTSDQSVEAWAQAHGMVDTDGLDETAPRRSSSLVATNP